MGPTKDPDKCQTITEVHTALLNMIQDGVAIIQNGTVQLINPALSKMIGGNIEGQSLDDYLSIQEVSGAHLLPTGSDPQFKRGMFRTLDNRSLHVEFTSTFITYNGREAELFIIRDVTQQIEMAIEAEKCETRYSEIMQMSPIAFFTLSQRGIIQDMNDAAVKMLGFEKDKLMKRHASVLFPRDEHGKRAVEDLVSAVAAGKTVTDVEVQFRKADGSDTWVSVTSYPILFNGVVESIMLIALDINRRRQAEIRAKAEQDRANLYLEVMTHDLNNINQELVFSLGLLVETIKVPESIQNMIDQTMWNIRRSARMIRNMRLLLQFQTEPPEREPIDFVESLNTAIDTVKNDLTWKHITVNYDVPSEGLTIIGNQYVSDIFFNVIHNAAFFDPSDDVTIDIHVEHDESNERVRVLVDDNGPGIPEPIKKAIFRRIEEGSREKAGRGLGLTLINIILQTIDGNIWVEDRIVDGKMKGTRVTIEFSLWTERVVLPCGNKTCITFYKSDHCLFCEPSREILLQVMQTMGVARKHLEIVNVDDPTVELGSIDLSMLPVVRICDTKIHGFFEESAVQAAIMNLMLKPCFPDT